MPSELPSSADLAAPSTFDPLQYSRIKQVNVDPVGTPVHHTTISADRRFEDVSVTVRGLEQNRIWIFLGFAYALIPGIDRSLFEIYSGAAGATLDVQTVELQSPLCFIADSFNQNPWAYKVQGVRRSLAPRVIDFIASYRFHRRAELQGTVKRPELHYRIDFEEIRMADPTVSEEKRPVSIWFAKPVNLTTGRAVVLSEGPGLMLRPPKFTQTTIETTNGKSP